MICSTNVYLIRNHQWLMLLRNKKKHDVNQGKWIGVGGKLEAGETIEECAIRETKEETGLDCKELKLNGILYFHYDQQESEKIWIYTCEKFAGEMIPCNEGTLAWIDEEKLLSLSLWEGDQIYLQKMLQDKNAQFCYDLYYDATGKLQKAVQREFEE